MVGWALADHMRTDLVADALRMAGIQRRPPAGVLFHSDRGCQYTSGDYAALAAELGVTLSLGRKGQCWDNAVSESWFATFKNERDLPGRSTSGRGHFCAIGAVFARLQAFAASDGIGLVDVPGHPDAQRPGR